MCIEIKTSTLKTRGIERNMFYGAKHKTFEKASELRKKMTMAEEVLWKELKNRTKFNVKFRRQHPIDIFIADFYCHECKLVIEVDGDIHTREDIQAYDDGRTHDIEKFGIQILRFSNNEILNDLENVKNQILNKINSININKSVIYLKSSDAAYI